MRRDCAEHRAIEERIIESYGSDPNAKDLSRVLRVPGFLHRKDRKGRISCASFRPQAGAIRGSRSLKRFRRSSDHSRPKKTDDGEVLLDGTHISGRDHNEDRRPVTHYSASISKDSLAYDRHGDRGTLWARPAERYGMNGRSRRKTNRPARSGQDLEVTQGQRRRHRDAIPLCQAWRLGG